MRVLKLRAQAIKNLGPPYSNLQPKAQTEKRSHQKTKRRSMSTL